MSRLQAKFADLKAQGRSGLVTFVTAGDPDMATATELVKGLPSAGADVIEIGMPFTDPMADGPAIQAANIRALANGVTVSKTLDLVRDFRKSDDTTPIVLMGYFNPIYSRGVEKFVKDAKDAGADGLIVVDTPAEEDDELCLPARAAGLDFIRLIAPTTDAKRLETVMKNTGGFVYYVSVNGITGAGSATEDAVTQAVGRIKGATDLPIAVGFGIRTPEQAAAVAEVADAVVVGSAIIQRIETSLKDGKATAGTVENALSLVRDLAAGVRGARA